MSQKFTLNVNGVDHTVDADPNMPLLCVFRDDPASQSAFRLRPCAMRRLHGALDGRRRSCVTPLSAVERQKVVTLAGLGTPEKPHPLQAPMSRKKVPQCGYCINGWIMTAAAFLRDNKKPTDDEIRDRAPGLKCRCGTHMAILRAVKRAAAMRVEGGRHGTRNRKARIRSPRRAMLKAGGALVIGFVGARSRSTPRCADGATLPRAKPALTPDQLVSLHRRQRRRQRLVYFGKMDMGQGSMSPSGRSWRKSSMFRSTASGFSSATPRPASIRAAHPVRPACRKAASRCAWPPPKHDACWSRWRPTSSAFRPISSR